MRKLALFILCACLSLPAFADDDAKAKATQELAKQETVALGANRFLIFAGAASGNGQYGYTVDLIRVDDGVPHFEPLFFEEYSPDDNQANLTYGVAFLSSSYHFDKASDTLTFTSIDEEGKNRLHLTYRLDVDIFKLLQVDSQEICAEPCTPPSPKTVFRGTAHAAR